MNLFAKLPRRIRVGRKTLFILALLVTGLVANLMLIPAAGAAVQDLSTNPFSLSAALASDPSTFSDSATDISTYTRDAVEVNGLSTCGGYPNNPTNTYSVWYTYTPTVGGWLTLGTLDPGTNFDTVIEVWSGSVAAGNSVGCNDDAAASNRRSELSLQVAAGTNYWIAIRRYGAAAMPPTPQLGFAASFTSVREVYVDQTNGSDGNTGSAALPFRTIGKGESVLPVPGGVIHIVDPGVYNEAVTIGVPTMLVVPSGAVSVTSLTLTANPVTASPSFSAGTVNIQPGGLIQNGVDLAAIGGTVNVAAGTYAESLVISKDLALKGPSVAPLPTIQPAAGTTAITLNGGSASVKGLTIDAGASGTAIAVTGGGNHTIYRNNIAGNTAFGVDNSSATSGVNAAENFWGNATGPTHVSNPGGTGDIVTDNVIYRPWCTTAAPACLPRAGAATRLIFSTSPGNTIAGAAFASQPVVRAEDDLGNLDMAFTGAVTLAIKGGTGTAGATLGGTGTFTLNAINGVADFAGQGLNIDFVGQSYQLTATSGALNSSPTDSAVFNITADRLVVTTSPANPSVAGAPLALVVAAQDGAGHTDATFTGMVGLAIQNNPTSATLIGTTSKAAVAGVATFGGAGEANIQVVGIGYTLRASSGALTTGDTAGFDITAGTPTQLVFNPSPSDSTGGVAFPTQPVVEVQDAGGYVVTNYTGSITLTIATNPGSGTLAGTTIVPVSNGKASFSGLSIDKPGTGYTLQASSGALTRTSTVFNITVGSVAKLVFNPSPSNAQAGSTFPTQPKVEAQDAGGNLVTSFNGTVTLTIASNPGGGTLSGTATATAAGGVATFIGLSIDKSGAGYTLLASGGSAAGTSAAFTIAAGTPTKLVFTNSPGDTRAGVAFTNQPVVEARDAFDNTAIGFTGPVTLTITSATGAPGANLLPGANVTMNAVNGVASFSGLNIDKLGLAYQLTASIAGPLSVDSAAFNITATGLVFTFQPVTTPAGQTFVVMVAAQDASNNTDTTFNGAVTLAIKFGTGSPRATLGGTVTVNAVNGVADFSGQGLNIVKAASGYILTASASGLAGAESQPFDITGGTATRLVVTTSPSNTAAGGTLMLVVEARDTFDNLATSYVGVVDLTIASNPGGGTLSGTISKVASGGLASFGVAEGVNIDKLGVGYTLHVASGTFTVDSAAFNITASRLVFASAPGTTPVGAAFVQQPVLRAEDSFGTLDTTFTGTITLTILSGTGASGAALNGTVALAATGGVATFSRLAIDRVGTGYQLSATVAGLPSVTSGSFDITKAVLYAPLMLTPGYPDLVTSFSLSTSPIVEHKQVVVTVTVTNQGNALADPFWVDFYVNPSVPPTAANQPWDKSCGARRCEQGIAWYVDKTLAPGESITLTSTPGSYYAKNTVWNGSFDTSFLNLYLYADSWNPGVPTGAVYESNETNNRAEFHTPPALASAVTRTAAPLNDLPALPPRPARPEPER
jgi:hypothetical protein